MKFSSKVVFCLALVLLAATLTDAEAKKFRWRFWKKPAEEKEEKFDSLPIIAVVVGLLTVGAGILLKDKETQKYIFTKATMRKLMAEFIGTFFLVFTVGCNVAAVGAGGSQGIFVAISIGSVLMITIYALGNVSGANFNPAVTLALCLLGKLEAPLGLLYVAVQILAGIVATFSFTLLYKNEITFGPDGKKFNGAHALTCEFLYTFMLVYTVLNTACVAPAKKIWHYSQDPNQFFGLAIGFVIVAGGNAAGWISGGAFNPAVAIGLDVAAPPTTGWCMPYVFVQLLAAAVAAGVFKFMRTEFDLRETDAAKKEKDAETDAAAAKAAAAAYLSAEAAQKALLAAAAAKAKEQAEKAKDSADKAKVEGVPEEKLLAVKCAAEFIGTFFLVLTVGLNVLKGGVMDPADPMNEAAVFSIAASLMVMVYANGSISGAHLNPAVTVTLLAAGRDKMQAKNAGFYVAAQISGGIAASFVYNAVTSGAKFGLGPYGAFTWSGVVVAEFVFTFLLCFVVLSTATVKDNKCTKDVFGLCIGFAVVVGGYAIGPISGANLNPAVSWGITATHTSSFDNAVAYTIIQVLAGVAAAGVFRVLFEDTEFTVAAPAAAAGTTVAAAVK